MDDIGDVGALLKVMTSNIKNLDLNIQHVVVKEKPHGRSQKKQCYNNSWRYIQDNLKDKAQYVLGYVFFRGLPIEHAWVRVGKQHYDVTLTPDENHIYYSVYEVPEEKLTAYVVAEGSAPDLYSLSKFKG